MNRVVEASASPLPNALFWLERGYPSTLIFDPYAAQSADQTQKRRTAEGTQEVRAADILEEQIAPDTKRSPVLELVDTTQEVEAVDVLDVQSYAPPPAPPVQQHRKFDAIFAPARAEQVSAAAPPPPEPLAATPTPAPSPSLASDRQAITALATAEWERRRRVGHWLAGGALFVASAVILLASAVHAFAGESSGLALRSPRSEADARTGRTNVLLSAPAPRTDARIAAVAPQAPIPTVSIDALPAARRGRR